MKSVRDFVDIHNIDRMVPIPYDPVRAHKLWFLTSNSVTNARINLHNGLEKTLSLSPVLNR